MGPSSETQGGVDEPSMIKYNFTCILSSHPAAVTSPRAISITLRVLLSNASAY